MGEDSCVAAPSRILFADPPCLTELCLLRVTVLPLITVPSTNASRQQPQVIKCRELLFTEPDIIASPAYGDEHNLMVIMQVHVLDVGHSGDEFLSTIVPFFHQSLYKSGRLQARFQKLGIEAEDRASDEKHLKKEQEGVSGGKGKRKATIFMDMKAFCVEMMGEMNTIKDLAQSCLAACFLDQLSELDLCPSAYSEFMARKQAYIPKSAILNNWCYVLPSMKKGQLVRISRRIPEGCPFRNYRDLKRHWKNTYGYRLPEDEQLVVYYQVYFRPIGEMLFTYPSFCLRSRDLKFLPRIDPEPIIKAFIQDLATKVPSVCGQIFRLQEKSQYCALSLSSATQDLQKVNLTSEIPRSVTQNLRMNAMPIPAVNQAVLSQTASECTTVKQQSASTHAHPQVKAFPDATGDHSVTNNFYPPSSLTETTSAVNHVTMQPRSVPVFKQYPKATHSHIISNDSAKIIIPRYVPSFRSKLQQPVFSQTVSQSHQTQRCSAPPYYSIERAGLAYKAREDSCLSIQTNDSLHSLQSHQVHRPTFGAFSQNINFQQLSNNHGECKNKKIGRSECIPYEHSSVHMIPQFKKHGRTNINGLKAGASMAHLKTSKICQSAMSKGPAKRQYPHASAGSAQGSDILPKKPRSRPVIQDNIDVELLAKYGELGKANSSTLSSWLKGHGVLIKAKDKKTDLILKVQCALSITQNEQ